MDIFNAEVVARALDSNNAASPPLKEVKPEPFPISDWRQAAQKVTFKREHSNGSGPTIHPEDRKLIQSVFLLRQNKDIALCAHCKRPFLTLALAQHATTCTRAPSRRSSLHGTKSSATTAAASADATNATNGDQSSDAGSDTKIVISLRNKRKNDASAAALQNSKPKRRRQKPKPKPKPVFNIDKQCGVPLPNDQPCARSLTCKAHSMGAKRAVPGRSAPYDTLLANYQRQNLVKQASISAKEALVDSEPEDEALTPERELSQIMDGIQHTHFAPLDRKVIVPTRTRSQFSLREMLALAMLPRELNPSGDAIFGRALAFCSETPYNLQFVRAPAQRFYAQRAALLRKKQEAAAQAQVQAQSAQAQAQAQASQQRRK